MDCCFRAAGFLEQTIYSLQLGLGMNSIHIREPSASLNSRKGPALAQEPVAFATFR
jgi:hypothetical protein